ncbi:MAG: alpha-L-fucosidase [Acidobacteriia bacterium]|nr:alpha-L-fucosidase [Terriglobia bacterium]
MNSLSRRSFVKSVGLGAGLASLPSLASGSETGANPDVPLLRSPSSKGELRFRQVHLDFHTSPLITDVGADFDADEFVHVLKEASVNSINIFAKCHHGMAYYPTKVGVMHPGLKFDLLGKMIEACHKADILTPVYYTIMWDQYAAMQHSDWRVLDENGRDDGAGPLEAGWVRVCPNTPYLDYVVAQSEEIARNYEVDGFWFDILEYSPFGCFCPSCMRDREKLGLDSSKQEGRIKHSEMVLDRTLDRLSSAVKPYRPHATIFFNGQVRVGMRPLLKYYTQVEIESLPGGGWGYGHFAVMSRYVRNLGLDYLGMDARFQRSWGDFGGLRNQAALDYECFRMLAQAGKCSVGDQMHPRGRLVKPVYELIGRTYRSVAEKEPWCTGAKAVTEIGFLSTANFHVPVAVAHTDHGVTNMLAELHHQFDTLDRDSDFAGYKLIILPDSHRFDEELERKVSAYLQSGGKLILSHESGLDPEDKTFALPELGLEYVGPSPTQGNKGDYIEVLPDLSDGIPPMVHFTYACGAIVKAAPGTATLARLWKPYFDRNYLHFSSHRQTAYDQPTEYAAVAQKGPIIYISFPVFSSYAENSYLVQKLLVRNCIGRLLLDPLIKTDAPSTAEISVTEQKEQRIVHLLHYPAQRRCPDLDIVEDVIPLSNVRLGLRMEKVPRKVYLAPQRQSLKFEYAGGYAEVVVPSVRGHQMVVFET